MARRRKRRVKKSIIFTLLTLIIVLVIGFVCYKINSQRQTELRQNRLKQEIVGHYNQYVVTNKETDIYILSDAGYEKVGKIGDNQELMLDSIDITYETEYFKISYFDNEYYVSYKDVDVVNELKGIDDRYKRYVVFNKNIVTSIWIGYDDSKEMSGNDYKYAKKIWANTMEGYLKDKDNTWYSKPNNVVGVLVVPISGEIENESTKKRKVFYYINGTEPFNTQDVLSIIE